jgi:hypothetical protein
MSHGIKSLAQELPQYGRYNDDMVAHISSDEARLLKSLGGSGTINPTTGLPEFGMFGIGGGGGILGTGINKNASDPVSNALSNNPISKGVSNLVQSGAGAIDKGLVSLDKTVGNAIPGGWGTVASVAGSMMGLPTYAMVGLGALNGSGVMRKGGSFNLQGAIMGGAMAYGMSELGEYARAASGAEGASNAVEKVLEEGKNIVPEPQFGSIEEALPKNYPPIPEPTGYTAGANGTMQPTFDASAPLTEPPVNVPPASTPNAYQPPAFDPNYDPNAGIRQPISSSLARGEIGEALKTAGSDVGKAFSNVGTSISEGAKSAYDTVTNPQTYSDLGTKASNYADARLTDFGNTSSGIGKILTGSADPAAAAAVKAGTIMSPALAGGMTVYAGMGLAALDQQRQFLNDQAAAGNISNQQYQQELAAINAQADVARKAVAANPLQVNPGIAGIEEGPSLYARENSNETLYDKNPYGGTTLYAMGGTVSNPPDDQTNMSNQSPMTNLDQGGLMSMVDRTVPQQTFAAGGMPRFLSGGGDGMSDSIKANINGSQEARLADGEFVIPADVVSHIGNGSSKAGAKQLYSMMDRVRQARTGRKSQGKQINPRTLMAA